MLAAKLDPGPDVDAARNALKDVLIGLQRARLLPEAEAALDRVGEILGLRWPYWVPDTSHPYYCPEMDAFAQARGWPGELMKLWWAKNAALKMPLYIRCRFEHLPFISSIDHKANGRGPRMSPEEVRVSEKLNALGIRRMLAVPLHLSKGQVAMLVWAGDRSIEELNGMLAGISGDLLGVGHHFMRVAQQTGVGSGPAQNERSHLTPREWDCLRTLAQGYREAEVAQLAGISKVTVRFHLDNVVQKLGCKTRTQAVALAAQLGLLGPIGS